jgi:hypothetical protein
MASTISTTIVNAVTLGSGNYTGNLTITSTGAVENTSNPAILIDSGTLINDGTISSGGVGVRLNNGVFIDDGVISNKYQVVTYNYGGGTPTVLLESGAVVTNKFFAHGETSTLGVTGTTPFTLGNIDGLFINFVAFTFASDVSGFGLSGNASAFTGGKPISGMIAGDRLTITNFAATSDSFAAANELVLKNSSGTTETIDLTGFVSTGALALSSDGTNTTLVSKIVETISSPVTGGIALGSGVYASAISITNTGAVTGPGGAGGSNAAPGLGYEKPPTNGGVGIMAISGGVGTSLANQGAITGGSGGSGGNDYDRYHDTATGGAGGAGATGASFTSAAITNAGIIAGGTGGNGGNGASDIFNNYEESSGGGSGAAGGAGLILTGGGGLNQQSIIGGQGGTGGTGGYYLKRYGGYGYQAGGNGGGGGTGLQLSGGASFTNDGTIIGGGGGAGGLNGHRTGHNRGNAASGGTGNGVYLNGGTLTNAGLISGAAAVAFGATASTLVVAAGAVFNGAVAANAAAADWLEFASGSSLALGASFTGFTQTEILSAATVTLSGTLGSAVENDGTIFTPDGTSLVISGALTGTGVIIDDPSTIVLNGSVASGQTISFDGAGGVIELGDAAAFNGTIANFGASDTLLIDHFTLSSGSFSAGALILNGTNAAATPETLTIAVSGSHASADFTFSSDGAGNTNVITCFMPDTPILTVNGEVAAAALRAGDIVMTANGPMPVRWIGQSHVSTRFANKLRVLPILIKAGALGEGLPRRDLRLSPDHALFIGGVLIHAGALVNGVSIIRDTSVPEQFTYYHVELASHELLLAEGVAVESFIDHVDRMHFHNWAEHETLADAGPIAEMPYPRAKSARQLPPHIRRRISLGADRAA